ncbi:hypothetical protein [Bordetella genomosp. 10]|nr:hypothetical protein [Bordetella genomosp. 10]
MTRFLGMGKREAEVELGRQTALADKDAAGVSICLDSRAGNFGHKSDTAREEAKRPVRRLA